MATIMSLPQEVFNIILGYNDISVEDIINFRCVCKQFRWIVKYDKYMEKKFFQRWSSAKKLYDKHFKEKMQEKSKENKQKNERSLNFMETGINCARKLRNYMSLILHDLNEHQEIIDNLIMFEDILYFDEYLKNNILDIVYEPVNLIKHSFFIDEFKNLLTQPLLTDCNLTEKYCNIKMFRFMRQCLVKKKFYRFLNQSYKYQVLERMFTMVAQFVQPEKDIFYSNIEASLDNIASEVLKCLREKHPDHSILSTSAEIYLYWKNNNIDDNHWTETEGTQIMDTLEEYIFSKFYLNKWRLSSDTKLEYMCIDSVLKNKFGQELIFLIIYHSVARRLGLRCDLIRSDSQYFIIWNSKYFYIEKTELYTRPEDIKFAVGMIVTHQPTECAGVIVGWHQHFDHIMFSADNVTCTSSHIHMYELPLNHCSNYDFTKKQTNYVILTENNKMCYVEEDAITLTTPRWIDNNEIGRYFYKFEGTHYVPNKMLARVFPQDAAVTSRLLKLKASGRA
ncbi:hypothetical protein ACFW04_014647 [Cataglyphis niger]